MINRFLLFLGAGRARALFGLIAVTGLLSLMLNAADSPESVRPIQTVLALVALIGSLAIVGSALDREDRGRYAAILAPAVGAIILGLTVLPQFSLLLFGGALGWIVAGGLIFRSRAPMEYQKAVKALRKNRLPEAVEAMDELIKLEPNNPAHHRFRAELLRVWGKLDRARRDYGRMIELEPDSAVAHNGMAEVELQGRRYEAALKAAQRAHELAPDEWVTLYNLGMIEDRLAQSSSVVEHLTRALELRVPDTRHKLLIHLYLARAYARLGDTEAAQAAASALARVAAGLREWQTILKSEQAATLRDAIGADVAAAEALINGQMDVSALAADSPEAKS
jgi:predicted Zn-dependent protease